MQIADLMAQLYVLAANDGVGNKEGEGTSEAIKEAIYSNSNQTIFTEEPSGTYENEEISDLTYTVVTNGLATALTDAKAPASNYRLSFVDHGESGDGDFLTKDENTYVSPASLYYYVNTYPVDYTQGTFEQLTWKDGLIESYNTPLDLKTSQPGFIAMAHSAQYAVGRLDIELTFADELKDRNDEKFTEGGNGLQLKGVIVGQQKDVAWNFLPPTAAVTEKSIYDNTVGDNNDAKVLVFPTSPTTNEVKVVLEMLNNTDNAFIGANGQKIPGHSTFYVVASLNKNNADTVDGVNAIFQSDYKTTAKMTLKSLQNAYNTVPDLTATNLEFALSVDLSWQRGYTFEVDIQ